MSHPPVSDGYVMSPSQLKELWEYDMWLAHVLMDLPRRSCTAKPSESTEMPAMKQSDFESLKEQVRSMWIFASYHFTCKETEHGWGLFFSEHGGIKPFSGTNDVAMGWLAKAPFPDKCPTGHLYLRSPCSDNIYLGGPISLANYDEVDRVICRRAISLKEPRLHKFMVSKAPNRKIIPGHEVLWSYSLDPTKKRALSLHTQDEWQLDTCCSEVKINVLKCPMPVAESNKVHTTSPSTSQQLAASSSSPPSLKRKVGGCRPLKTTKCVQSYKPCTYCGINLPETLNKGGKENMKRHWALKHAVELCKEMGVAVDDELNPVSAKEFMKHLDKVDHVFNSLNFHNYKVVAACNFLDITGTPLLGSDASDEEKERIFETFLSEGRSVFQKYQVVYMKGISMPRKYEDLFYTEEITNYSKINWKSHTPSTTNFSLNSYALSEMEKQQHAQDIQHQLTNAVLRWKTN